MDDAISTLFVIRVHLTFVLVAFDVDAKLHLKDDAGSVYNVLDFVFDIGGKFCGLDSWTLLHTRLRPYPLSRRRLPHLTLHQLTLLAYQQLQFSVLHIRQNWYKNNLYRIP